MSMPAPEPSQTEIDTTLEQRIEQARARLDAAETQDARREAHEDLRWLIEQRQR